MSLKKLFRQVLVASLFAIFGLICLLGNLIFLPILILRLNKFMAFKKFARDVVRISWGFFIWLCKNLGYLDYKFDLADIPKNGSYMIVANHPSLLDVVFLISKIRHANCIVKGSLYKNIFLAPAICSCGYIPNTQNEELLEQSISSLKSGENLIIFPEGTRTKDEINFHKAASHIAIKAAKSVFGIAISMHPRSLRKNEPWYSTPNNMIKYDFKKLFCLDICGFYDDRASPIRARLLNDYMNEIYKKEFR